MMAVESEQMHPENIEIFYVKFDVDKCVLEWFWKEGPQVLKNKIEY